VLRAFPWRCLPNCVIWSMLLYPLLRPRWAKEEAMLVRKLRQRELFDENLQAARPTLPWEVRDEVLQLLTQWLRALSQAMVRESGDEQDRR
jgi:hypothetical protein